MGNLLYFIVYAHWLLRHTTMYDVLPAYHQSKSLHLLNYFAVVEFLGLLLVEHTMVRHHAFSSFLFPSLPCIFVDTIPPALLGVVSLHNLHINIAVLVTMLVTQ